MKTGIILSFILIGLAASAQAERFDCNMGYVSRTGWIGKHYVFVVDRNGDKTTAFDAIIQSVNKSPVEAEIIEDKGSRLRLSWGVRNLTSKDSVFGRRTKRPKLTYYALINKSNGRIKVRTHVGGNEFESAGQGKCEISG